MAQSRVTPFTPIPTLALDELTTRELSSRYWGACEVLTVSRREFESFPSNVTAGQVRWSEIQLEDAIALAGEFEVPNLPWSLS
jgi:hypothetical protein